ncbi:MAG TPA: metallophosphoesterase [Polyangiaceae bacterium]|nr:metallophosphoesterase [Polyangiaceae bacterium]
MRRPRAAGPRSPRPRHWRWVLGALLGVAALACRGRAPAPAEPGAAAEPTRPVASSALPLALVAEDARAPRWRHPAVPRLVAVGDLHGDLAAARAALRLAGAVDERDRWIGSSLVVVQTGDVLDRGDDERELLAWLDRVAAAARDAGGALHRLVGNHEVLNVQGDLRYVTSAGLAAFATPGEGGDTDPRLARFAVEARGRARAFLPGGPLARHLAEQPVVLVVGDSVFVHGGLREAHLRYGVTRLEREARAFMTGEGGAPPALVGEESPVWSRRYSDDPLAPGACAEAERVTTALGVARMVVGHTVQQSGITSACEGRVWRIDVGLSAYYGGGLGALEITAAGARALRPGR